MLVDLTKFSLVFADGHTGAVKDNETGAGGARVDGADKAILEVVFATVFILEEGAIAVVGRLGAELNVRLLSVFLFVNKRVEVGHVEGVSHDRGVECGGGEMRAERGRKKRMARKSEVGMTQDWEERIGEEREGARRN